MWPKRGYLWLCRSIRNFILQVYACAHPCCVVFRPVRCHVEVRKLKPHYTGWITDKESTKQCYSISEMIKASLYRKVYACSENKYVLYVRIFGFVSRCHFTTVVTSSSSRNGWKCFQGNISYFSGLRTTANTWTVVSSRYFLFST